MKGFISNTLDVRDFSVTGPDVASDLNKLQRISSPSLFCYLAVSKFTGTMRCSANEGTFNLSFKDGSLIGAEQEGIPFLESVLNSLCAAGTVQPDAAAKALATAKETSRSLLQVLYEQGACTPRDLVEALRSTKQAIVEKVMVLKSATFELTPTQRPPRLADPVALDLNIFMVRYIRERTRSSYQTDLEPLLAPFMGRYPLTTERLTPAIAGVAFSEKERKTLTEVADGSITLKEVFSLSLLPRGSTARLFIIASMLGLVEYRLSPLPKGGVEAFEQELKATYERMKGEDYFTRLGIHWTSHPTRIEPAYQKMVERYGPMSKARQVSPKAAEVVDAIFELVKEAYEVLKDQERRRAYRQELLGTSKLEFGVEFLYKQAHLARFRGEIEKAREIIECAIDIIPKKEFEDFRRSLPLALT